jgi:nuclear transport factor 2 (NTF2) superfamily protein
MISTRRFGRLGNELYQLAMVVQYALKHDLEWTAPSVTNNETWNPCHFRNLANPKWIEGEEDVLINEVWNTEQQYYDVEFCEEWRDKQIVLNGYWQSYKYFDWCKNEIIKVFNYPYELNKNTCSIHVRRGDYLLYPTRHPLVTEDYLWGAIQEINKINKYNFLVHSDDISWCKETFSKREFNAYNFSFSEGKSETEDLISMANCENQICSNSTLALWGAELNKNPNKIVVTPSEDNWFGKDNKHLTVKDLIRPEFIQISYKPIYEL